MLNYVKNHKENIISTKITKNKENLSKKHKILIFLIKNLTKVLKYIKFSVIIGVEMKIITNNKKAYHNFFVSDLLEAGIELKGGEIKSVAGGKVSLSDSYVEIKNGEAIMKNCYIAAVDGASQSDSQTKRARKLLLHKAEIVKLERKVKEKGFSIVPTKVYLNGGKAKVEIGLAKGKKLYDKREVLKDRAVRRDIDRAIKND
jgi:SsrA-binding protein